MSGFENEFGSGWGPVAWALETDAEKARVEQARLLDENMALLKDYLPEQQLNIMAAMARKGGIISPLNELTRAHTGAGIDIGAALAPVTEQGRQAQAQQAQLAKLAPPGQGK